LARLERARFHRVAAAALTSTRGVAARIARALVLVAGALVLATGMLAPARAQTPTPEQLEILRSLPPEQQQEILRQISEGRGRSDRTERRGAAEYGEQEDENQALRQGRADREEIERMREERERRILLPDDTVIVEIGFPRPRIATTPTPGESAADQPAQPSQPAETEPLTERERTELERLIERVRARNPYRLDANGALRLPGFDANGILLAGLDQRQATLRLQAEPAFRRLEVSIVKLPVRKTGVAALKPFGYDLFDDAPSTFAPVTEVPVPADYVVGPGDELDVQLYGNQNRNLTLRVGRDGRINFPELGPISVGGQRFSAVKAGIESRVERQMIGVRASVSMGDTRSIRIFVLGEANRPGSYTVSGLATMTTALFASGGVKPIGSLRDVQLKRQGNVVRRLDLYDLLIRGDSSDDAKLLPGDVIFIPPVGPTVSVDGEVHRPAVYELRGETTVTQLVEIAGGLTPEADRSKVTVSRIGDDARRIVLDVDLAAGIGTAEPARNGDVLRVARLRPTLDRGVLLEGHVYAPGPVAWREGLRIADVIGSIDELRPNADANYILVRREDPETRRVSVLSTDLLAALARPESDANLLLLPRDRIVVFDLDSPRDRVMLPLLEELRLQGTIDRPTQVVRIEGRVRAPGEYPLEPGMTVRDLIRAGGSLQDAAYGGQAELTRYKVVRGESRRTQVIDVNLEAALSGDPAHDVLLEPFDLVNVKEMPQWTTREFVRIEGEVRFPGDYPIKRGETLKSVLERAGGLSELAFPEGAVFTRDDLKQREQEQLDVLAQRLQGDLATLALQAAQANQGQAGAALSVGQSLLAQLRSAQAVGRLVIDLERALRGESGSLADILLRDGDRLIVPKLRQEVTVIGEVQSATSHFYRPDLSRDDYIAMSGGTTRKADRGKIYVVRANGSVIASESNAWFRRGSQMQMRPGDTVVVPLDTERLPSLPFWQAVTSIIYNLAISAAAVNSF
jgi:protein involved in polysaccharide export with SLBB domain